MRPDSRTPRRLPMVRTATKAARFQFGTGPLREHPAPDHRLDPRRAHRPSSTVHASLIVARVSGGATRKEAATRRTRSLSDTAVTYSTGDLPSIRAMNRPGSRLAVRASSPSAAPRTPAEIARGQRSNDARNPAPLRGPQAFQQEVIEAEGEVEGGIAVPGAFGVEKDRARSGRAGCSSG